MKVVYDTRTDTLTVRFKDDVAIVESDEEKPGIILDYDAAGEIVSLEILDASRRVTDAKKVEFSFTDH
jgi:uncharacterized protein YuzE